MTLRTYRRCMNCEDLVNRNWQPLCPSCQKIGAWGIFVGGLLVGLLQRIFG